jgi:carbon-monoxide dehydrogenase medium subunit
MTFAYERPRTAEALGTLLAEHGEQACLLAGGTDLLVMIRAGLIRPRIVADVKAVEELQALQHYDDGGVFIGAAVTINRIVDDARFGAAHVGLKTGAAAIATYAIRNRATVVGNVSNASPCADTVSSLCLLEAQVELRSTKGTRRVLVRDFVTGVKKTAREANEYVAGIHIPPQSKGTRTFFRKRQRVRGHDLALANASVIYDPDKKRLRVAVGSCSPRPAIVELDDMFAKPDLEEAARRAMSAIAPISDVRASAEYRSDMTGMLVRRLLEDVRG